MRVIGATHGTIQLLDLPEPKVEPNYILIDTVYSAISPGTEKTMSTNSQENLVKMGYSAAGIIREIGEGVEGFAVGDRVAVYGAPYTGHREVLSVPKTLVNKVPDTVKLEEAAMGGLGAIAIHGLRQGRLQFGEVCVVVGLGIYGQLIAQIAYNAGMVVLPLNRSPKRAELLERVSGIKSYSDEKEMEEALMKLTNGRGADAVFLCAGGDSNYLTNKSLEWLRDRGTSVIVGDIQPNYNRELMFGKELEIRISRAGGPGRYDASFERNAVDYPYGYVRWTEGRNVGEFIRLVAEKRINVSDYIDEATPVEDFNEAYATLFEQGAEYLSHCFKFREV